MKDFSVQGLSIRGIAHRLINAGTVPSVIGTPKDVAYQLEAWFEKGAADGFNLMFPLLPEDWLQFGVLVRDLCSSIAGSAPRHNDPRSSFQLIAIADNPPSQTKQAGVLRHDRNHYRGVFRALALVDA